MKLSSFNIKKFLIVSETKAFLIPRETETPQKILYISGNGTFLYFRKLLIFQEVTFRARKITSFKMFLIFQEMELFFILKNFLYCRKELTEPENQKITADLSCMPNVSNNEFLGF